ncbi:pantothenate kinase [Arboricoccus pini]|uniref:Type III pantothenate kinase n=1 Tax=Arboricoccus pini TaxID=1963835 RepID=A0A212PWD7_9PROT|nr:type III pantothenate kinase [Arboricoccus pini]SNB51333.1 pantothenate kinase [Arboricoccus pini]
MLLAIDVGNTNTVFALYRGRQSIGQWRLSTVRDRTAEEYAVALIQLMQLKGLAHGEVGAVLISSVVPQAVMPLRWMSRDFFNRRAFVVGEDLDYPIRILLSDPREIGADRVVNAVAALSRYQPPLIVVDFGTATTFDVVDAEGAYRGGVIAPGINLSIEALHRAAAKLPRIAIEPPPRVIGQSTVGAMQSGIFWGYVGLIEGLVRRIEEEYGTSMKVIATGGLAPLFARRAPVLAHIDRDLTMAGLLELYERYRPQIDQQSDLAAGGAR